MRNKATASVLLSAIALVGCDKDTQTTSATQPTVVVPTTQQLLAGPRSKLDLKYAPFTLEVPQGWELKTLNDAATVVLEGATPTDFVSVSIPVFRIITADQEKSLEAHAVQGAAEHPGLMKSPPVRDFPGTKMIEQLILDAPSTPISGAKTEPIQTLQWTFTLCIPNGNKFTAYDLRVMGMTTEQYKKDQEFVRSIVGSASYIPSPADPAVK